MLGSNKHQQWGELCISPLCLSQLCTLKPWGLLLFALLLGELLEWKMTSVDVLCQQLKGQSSMPSQRHITPFVKPTTHQNSCQFACSLRKLHWNQKGRARSGSAGGTFAALWWTRRFGIIQVSSLFCVERRENQGWVILWWDDSTSSARLFESLQRMARRTLGCKVLQRGLHAQFKPRVSRLFNQEVPVKDSLDRTGSCVLQETQLHHLLACVRQPAIVAHYLCITGHIQFCDTQWSSLQSLLFCCLVFTAVGHCSGYLDRTWPIRSVMNYLATFRPSPPTIKKVSWRRHCEASIVSSLVCLSGRAQSWRCAFPPRDMYYWHCRCWHTWHTRCLS